MNSRVLLLASLFGGIMTLSTKAQTITAPTGQNLTITNPVDVTGTGNSVNIPSDGSYKIGGVKVISTLGSINLFMGVGAGGVNTGSSNLFVGSNSGYNNTTGNFNTFIGAGAGQNNTTGVSNICIGNSAGFTMNGIAATSNLLVGNNAGYGITQGGYNTCFGTNAGYNLTTGSGNVVIGPSAGGANLVDGSSNTFIGNGAVAGSLGLSNATAIGANSSVTTSNSLILGSGVNVGIGNSAPTARLEITAAGGSGLKFTNLTSGSATTSVPGGKVLGVDAVGNVVLVQISGATTSSTGTTAPVADATWKNQDGYLYNNSTNGVVINGSGLEGNALIVKGGVLSKEVNVKVEGSESWPDYVFKPSYKRMSLDEVEKFININGHLPNVPSATEMVATGNNLGKTDVKLLEKVEELTLYLLEMKKANDAQNAEIQNLKKQVKSLRKK